MSAMSSGALPRLLAKLRNALARNPFETYLADVSGVIHVGAHLGQERDLYARYGLAVLWIEPLEAHFRELERNIAPYPSQRAVRALVTNVDGVEHTFHVASNTGASSSILELAMHADAWPDVHYVAETRIVGTTLPSLLAAEGIDPSAYDALVVDTQGADLLVLQGAEPLLDGFGYVQVEAPDFEAYRGCGLVTDIDALLAAHGFAEIARRTIGRHPSGGRYYDLLYRKRTRTR